jgi:hypothetical protein
VSDQLQIRPVPAPARALRDGAGQGGYVRHLSIGLNEAAAAAAVPPRERFALERTMAKKKPKPTPAAEPVPPKRGPTPETLKLDGEWQANVAKALQKKRPPGGWPKQQ